MKRHIAINLLLVAALISLAACNGSGSAQQGFTQFTQDTFSREADDRPVDVENVNLIFDVENNESVFDRFVRDGEFAV